MALALYPPSWRARYEDEVLVLIEDSGGRLGTVASVAWRALPAWIWPPRHLHDRSARMRSSLATALFSWSMLIGLGLLFAQLTQLQGFTAPGHPAVRWAYAVFDVALAVSALVAGLGGLPLWLLMLRRAWREWRAREILYLLLPLIAPAAYLGALIVTIRLLGRTQGGIGPVWFGAVTLAGFAAAAIAAAGPGLALRRLQPRGPALRLAATAAGVSAAVMAVAAGAIVVAVTGLCLWARSFAGYHHGTIPAIYLALVAAAATITTVSAARGVRAARAEA
jgi:MFS family permease